MRWLNALLASRDQLEAAEERSMFAGMSTTRIADVAPRDRATVAGKVVALTYQPRGEKPAITARLSDGTGVLGLVFLGRRDVPGVSTGRRLIATGMVGTRDGLPIMFNPEYQLLPVREA